MFTEYDTIFEELKDKTTIISIQEPRYQEDISFSIFNSSASTREIMAYAKFVKHPQLSYGHVRSLASEIGWGILQQNGVHHIIEACKKLDVKSVLEIGSGNGLNARIIRDISSELGYPLTVFATDADTNLDCEVEVDHPFVKVIKMSGLNAIKHHLREGPEPSSPIRVIFVSYTRGFFTNIFEQILYLSKSKVVIVMIGSTNGSCADISFYRLLKKHNYFVTEFNDNSAIMLDDDNNKYHIYSNFKFFTDEEYDKYDMQSKYMDFYNKWSSQYIENKENVFDHLLPNFEIMYSDRDPELKYDKKYVQLCINFLDKKKFDLNKIKGDLSTDEKKQHLYLTIKKYFIDLVIIPENRTRAVQMMELYFDVNWCNEVLKKYKDVVERHVDYAECAEKIDRITFEMNELKDMFETQIKSLIAESDAVSDVRIDAGGGGKGGGGGGKEGGGGKGGGGGGKEGGGGELLPFHFNKYLKYKQKYILLKNKSFK